jgi:hypothetical protein
MAAISTPEEYQREIDLRQHLDHRLHYEKARSVTTVETREVDNIDNINKDASRSGLIHWQPGIRARFPWLGLSAILTMLACIAFSIIILVTSDGKVAEEWPSAYIWLLNSV